MMTGCRLSATAQGRPQYRPFLQFLTTQERNVIWLLLAIALLPVDGTTLGLYAPFWSPISPALFAVYCLCNWRQLRIVANRYLPMFLLPVACIILSIPGWLKFGIPLNAAFMSITGLLGVLATLGAIAIADSHRFLLVLLRRGRVAMAIHPSAFQAAHQLLLTPHVPSVHRRQLDVGRWSPAVPVRGARLYRHASVRRIAAAYVAYAWVRPYLCQAVAQPHRCVCDWLCADAGRHPDRSSRESTRVLTRYAGCSPIRGRCLPDMAPAISSTRYGPARSMQDDC